MQLNSCSHYCDWKALEKSLQMYMGIDSALQIKNKQLSKFHSGENIKVHNIY